MSNWVLAIDYGTTNTVAAVCGPGVEPKALRIQGDTHVPSAVYLEDDASTSHWVVGRAAVNSALVDASRFEPNPKRRIAEGNLFLAGRDVPVHAAIAAVLREVMVEAVRQHDNSTPDVLVVTHPVSWTGTPSLTVLQKAITAATADWPGRTWPEPLLIPEPVAAGLHAVKAKGLPFTSRIVVCDLGGGTLDVAVVERSQTSAGDSYRTLGVPRAVDPLGGEDFDFRLTQWALEQTGEREVVERLSAPTTPGDLILALDVRRSARLAKEDLSSTPRAHIRIPSIAGVLPDGANIQVSRSTFESLVAGSGPDDPGLRLVAATVKDAVADAGGESAIDGVFLVGGSSRIPMLGRLVIEEVGVTPKEHGDPGTAVAEGAARFAEAYRTGLAISFEADPVAKPAGAPPPPVPPVTVPPSPDPAQSRPLPPPVIPPPDPNPEPRPTDTGNGSSTKEWYKQPAALISIGVVALVLLVGIVGAALGGGGGDRTADRGSPTPKPSVTCADGTVVTGSSACPAAPAGFTCHETGAAASSPSECPWPTGEVMIAQVASPKAGAGTCAPYTGEGAAGPWEEIYRCTLDSGQAYIKRYASVVDAQSDTAAAANSQGFRLSEGGFTIADAGPVGDAYDLAQTGNARRLYVFDDAPYGIELQANSADLLATVASNMEYRSDPDAMLATR